MNDQQPLIKSTAGKTEYYRSDNSDKPSGAPTGGKSFKKILDSDSENQGDGDETVDPKVAKDEAGGDLIAPADSTKAGVAKNAKMAKSPFALFAHTEDKETLAESAGMNKTDQTTSPFNLTQAKKPVVNPQINSSNESAPLIGDDSQLVSSEDDVQGKIEPETDEIPVDVDKLKKPTNNPEVPHDSAAALERSRESLRSSKNENFNSQFAREQPDLSYVNPMVTAVQQTPIGASEVQVQRPLATTDLQSLVEQLVKELSVVKQGDKTETSIVLNNPPQFDGVKIVITTQESASNQFNVRFENLTQAAKQVMDQAQNRADLMSNLEKKGYNVHIFITTTYSEPSLMTAADVQAENKRQDQGEEEQQKQRDDREERQNKQK